MATRPRPNPDAWDSDFEVQSSEDDSAEDDVQDSDSDEAMAPAAFRTRHVWNPHTATPQISRSASQETQPHLCPEALLASPAAFLRLCSNDAYARGETLLILLF